MKPTAPSIPTMHAPLLALPLPAPSPARAMTWTDLEATPPCLMRMRKDGVEEKGVLQKGEGDDSFASVHWPDGSIEPTEISNVLLIPLKKRPASAALKRPAAPKAKILRAPEPLKYDPVLARPDVILEHSVLYYKNGHNIGIRVKGGGKQIFSFGGKRCMASEAELREIGLQVCKKLAEGWTVEGAREWACASVA